MSIGYLSRKPIALALSTFTLLIFTIAVSAFPDVAIAQEEIGSVAERANRKFMHFRVMWMHNPQHEAVISWSTADKGTAHRVHYDIESREGQLDKYAESATPFTSARYTMIDSDRGTPSAYFHHVHLTDLEPSAKVYFVVESDGQASEEFHFITAPEDGRAVKVVFGGDSRRPPALPEVHEDRRRINQMVAELAGQDPEIIAFCHGGDYCTRAQWQYMTDWLSDHELTTTADGRILPIIPARGNHDTDVVFEEIFAWPERDHDYFYSTKLSARAVVISLNTEISMGGDQRQWLAKELERQRAEPGKTILVQYHKPAYGSVKSFEAGAPQRQYWVPLFEKFQVDLVAESDHHSLKRTLPIFQGEYDPERGITYIGDGGLGVPQRTVDSSRWYLQDPGMTAESHHVHIIEFGEDAISARAIGLDRKTLDEIVIESKELAVP